MRKAPVRYELLYGKPLRRCTLLRQDGAHACKRFLRKAAEFFPVQQNLARIAPIQSGERTQERRLARTVGADDRRAPSGRDLCVQSVKNLPARDPNAQIAGAHPRTHSCLRRR